ncbi:carbon-nitrogen hydrolase family protein [Streptomyces sp. NPDC059009]|uniref:carbon-nitrogen hydrolase family protein n=1 Tax=Streptomyces sp. NPDC059009 TaxID=3346694 RepID=UPI0036B5D66F
MRVALGQLAATADPEANLVLVEKEVDRAAAAGARLLVLPEATMCRFGVPLRPVAEPLDGPWASRVRDLARDRRLAVVVGMFTPADGERVRNTVLVAGPDGRLTSYDKIHLYDAFGHRESETVAPGDRPLTVDLDGVRIGVATCYDIRFPGLFTELASQGAQLTVVPASWGAGPGKREQWTLLARARALDSTAFVVAVGQAEPAAPQAGAAPTGVGGSLAVSPLGEIRAELGDGPDFTTIDLDLGEVTRARETVPVLANRRW